MPAEAESSVPWATPPGLSAPPVWGRARLADRWFEGLGRQIRRPVRRHHSPDPGGCRSAPPVGVSRPGGGSHPCWQGPAWLSGCQARSERAQLHPMTCCLVAFCVLERDRHDRRVSLSQLKRRLSFKGRSMALSALERLRSPALPLWAMMWHIFPIQSRGKRGH